MITMSAEIFLMVILIVSTFTAQSLKPQNMIGHGEAGKIVSILNSVLGVTSSDNRDFIIILKETHTHFPDVTDIEAPWGVGVFIVDNNNNNNNNTNTQLSQVVAQARQLRQVSWSVTVVVMSDDPAFLDAFAEWCLKGRLLVWSTKLLVLTRLSLNQLSQIRHTLGKTNSMLLKISENSGVKMYVDHPYSQPGTQPISVASWSHDRGITKISQEPFYPDKFMRLSQRPRLVVSRVIIATEKTLVIDDPDHPGEKKIVGLNAENELIETISKAMNFTIKYVAPPDGQWGYLENNGFWTGMVGMVYRQEAEIGLGLFTMTPQRYQVVDFTYPVAINYARIMAARGSPEVTLWGFLLPLTLIVWVGILVALGLYMAVMLVPSCLPAKTLNQTRLFSSASNCIRILLQQDLLESEGWWWWERVLVGVWMLMTLVLTKSYSGNLMSLLAVRHIPEPYHALEDLIDSSINVMFVKGTSEEGAFKFAKSGIKRDVWNLKDQNRIVLFSTNELDKVQAILLEGKTAMINLDMYLKKRMSREFTKTGKCVFSLSRNRYLPALDSMAGAKDNPIVPALARKVMQISEAGLYDYWQTSLFPNSTSCLNSPTTVAVMSALSIKNIWGMFLVLAGGCLVSVLAFCLELCVIQSRPHIKNILTN